MVAGAVSQVVFNAGKLVVGPTSTSTPGSDTAYGGTEIGLVKNLVLTPLGVSRRVEDEGLGEAVEILQPNNRYVVSGFLRGVDDDAKQLLLKSHDSAGAKTQHRVVTVPGNRTPGQGTIDYSNVVLLFVPENPTDHDAMVVYRAIPLWDDNTEIAFQRQEEFGIPLSFECLRNANSKILQFGRMPDLSVDGS